MTPEGPAATPGQAEGRLRAVVRHWALRARATAMQDHHLEDDVIDARILAEEATEVVNELPVDPVVIGLGGFGGLIALLLVTYAFRSVGSRH